MASRKEDGGEGESDNEREVNSNMFRNDRGSIKS